MGRRSVSILKERIVVVGGEETEWGVERVVFGSLVDGDVTALVSTVRQKCKLSATAEIEDVYTCTKFQEALMALAIQKPGSYMSKQVIKIPSDVHLEKFKTA